MKDTAMKKQLIILVTIILMVPLMASAGLKRVDISPMVLINLDESQAINSDSRFLGGAVAGDLYFSQHFAIRTTVGYVKNVYNSSVTRIDRLFGDIQTLDEPSYSLRLSVAPYADANVGGILRPYVTLSGGFGYIGNPSPVADIRAPQTQPLSNASYVTTRSSDASYYDFTGSVGLKVPVASNISVFGEVSHRIYSSYDTDGFFTTDASGSQIPFGFDEYKTMLSLGMSYSIRLGE